MALSIVALRAAGIGDLITAVPAIRALAKVAPIPADPEEPGGVYVATGRWLHGLADLIPGVRPALDVSHLTPLDPPADSLFVNLHGSGPQSHRALLDLEPRALWAYRHSGFWPHGPKWEVEENERERWCRLLRWHDIPADPTQVGLRRPLLRPAAPGAVVLHLGASTIERRWPSERFAQLVGCLEDWNVVLTGGPGDRSTGLAVAAASGLPPEANLTGKLSLPALAAQVASARLVVTGDTGVAHMAVAYGTPSVTVFGPACLTRWGPPALSRHRVARSHTGHRVAAAVPLGTVLNHISALLEMRGAA